MGLGCAALTSSSTFPTYPNPLSAAQNGAGLSSPATAIALLGKGGAGLLLLLLFMAVTSSTSAELIAVGSLFTFDVYKTYIKPSATSVELVRISHYGILGYALVLAAFCCILNAASINLTWILTVLGVIVGGASIPVGLTLLWDRMSTVAVLFSPWIGFTFGLTAWFVVTHLRSGVINVATTGNATNAVAGNITSVCTGVLMAVVLSYVFPGKFQSTDPDHISRANKINGISTTTPNPSSPVNGLSSDNPSSNEDQKQPGEKDDIEAAPPSSPAPETLVKTGNDIVDFLEASHIEPMNAADVRRATRLAVGFNVLFLSVAIIFVPFLLFGGEWIFSQNAFVGWCVVSFLVSSNLFSC